MAARKKRKKKAPAKRKPKAKPRAEPTEPAPAAPSPRAAPHRPSGKLWLLGAAAALVIGFIAWQAMGSTGQVVPEVLTVRVVAEHPHDTDAFTQGLLWHDGKLYESTGRYGSSTLRRVDLASGDVEEQTELSDDLFAEGLARVGERLIQLTWRARRALVYDLSLTKVDEHEYHGEGWGLCYDGERLVMSNGSDRLVFRDPETFERQGEVRVKRAGRRVRRLNELECVDGAVYANIWMDDHIARIDPETGDVTGWIDASQLIPPEERDEENVLNGIAYVRETGHFLLTGKNWPSVFEVEIVAD